MRITAHIHGDKGTMWDLGEKAGLTGNALSEFQYACYEVKIELEVDPATGKSDIVKVDDKDVKWD